MSSAAARLRLATEAPLLGADPFPQVPNPRTIMKTIPDSLLALLLFATSLLSAAQLSGRPAAAPELDTIDGREPDGQPRAMSARQKITTFLWYDDDAEEAVRFYTSIFKGSKVLEESRWGEGGPLPEGTLMTARFQLAGQEFMALNGGPMDRFTEAISLLVDCESQHEVDGLWEKLGEGGEPGRCGWLKDRYGLSWQIIPSVLGEMMGDKDPAKAKRVVEAMLQMDKLDIARLQKAYDGR
jgi:predicted 3-demethylubiquinone-9 3-methyltransferase (glyoxalase superfamily)